MSVHVTLRGRLGNNLFQYAIGRIIAEHHGLELRCTQLPLAPSHPGQALGLTAPATLEELSEHFPDAPLRLPGQAIEQPVESHEVGPGETWGGQVVDLARILSDARPRKIRLHGYFQRFEYYAPYANEIRRWFRLSGVDVKLRPGSRDILVNIRRGIDFGLFARVMPMAYYEQTLDRLIDHGRVYVCGTDVDETVRKRLERYRPVYVDGTPIEHFALFARFNRIVLSNSSFAWWAAFLSDATEIFAPRPIPGKLAKFAGLDDVDLNTGEPRYHEVDLTRVAELQAYMVNRIPGARLFDMGPDLAVEIPGVPALRLPLGEPERKALGWLTTQREPVLAEELARRFAGVRLGDLMRVALRHRVASLHYRYREPDAGGPVR